MTLMFPPDSPDSTQLGFRPESVALSGARGARRAYLEGRRGGRKKGYKEKNSPVCPVCPTCPAQRAKKWRKREFARRSLPDSHPAQGAFICVWMTAKLTEIMADTFGSWTVKPDLKVAGRHQTCFWTPPP